MGPLAGKQLLLARSPAQRSRIGRNAASTLLRGFQDRHHERADVGQADLFSGPAHGNSIHSFRHLLPTVQGKRRRRPQRLTRWSTIAEPPYLLIQIFASRWILLRMT